MGGKNARKTSPGPEAELPASQRPLDAAMDAERLGMLESAVNRILVDAQDEAAALGDSMATIAEWLGSNAVRFWALDSTGDALRVVATRTVGDAPETVELPGDEVLLGAAEGLIGAAWREQAPLWIADVSADGRASAEDLARLAAAPGVLLVPAHRDEAASGVFEFPVRPDSGPSALLLRSLSVLTRRVIDNYAKLAELKRLHENDECNNSTFALAAIGIGHVADDGTLIHVNRRLCELLGYSEEELIGKRVQDISHPEDASVTREDRERLRSGAIDSFTSEKRYLRKDGTPVWVRLTVAARRDQRDRIMYHVSVVEDISERKSAEEALRASEAFYHETFELAAIGISHVGADGTILHVNRRLCEMLGYASEELVGLTVGEISHPEDVHASDAHLARLQAGEVDAFKLEKRYLRKDGTPMWAKITVAPKRAPDGQCLYHVSLIEDISDRKAAEQRIEYLATHDELTGLPNRAMFAELLGSEIEVAKRYERQFGVFFVDLDRFKLVNDSLGHEAGDALLKRMSSRFRECLRNSDVVARLGGDEFVILAREIENREQIGAIARKLLSAALKPVDIGGHECRVTASIGVCMFPDDAQDVQSLMKSADMAMYLAKEEGKNNFQFVSEAVNSRSYERLTLENALRRAFERNEFFVEYQPKVDISTGDIKGVEALLRWNSADLGSVPPARFIPLAEEMGLIVPIGKWVLKEACAQNVAWQKEGLPPMTMAVNLSPRQFRDPDLLQDISGVLESLGMAAELLELEITEGMLMHDVDQAVAKLNGLKEMGVRLSIDDFGTGYSSLAQLKRFPIDTLKVDRSFIRELSVDAEDQAITEAIIAMGRTLGVVVIAEGVETADQQSFLKSRHCDQIQGFYFSKPAGAADVAAQIQSHLLRRRG